MIGHLYIDSNYLCIVHVQDHEGNQKYYPIPNDYCNGLDSFHNLNIQSRSLLL